MLKTLENQLINKVLLVGSGAVSHYLSAFLQHELDVTVVGNWIEGLKGLGVGVTVGSGTKTNVYKGVKTTLPKDLQGHYDLVIWLCKIYQNEDYAPLLNQIEFDHLLCLQNGIHQEDLFLKYVLPEKLSFGVVNQGVKLENPGKVEDTGKGGFIFDNKSLFELWLKVGLNAHIVDDITKYRIKKLGVNLMINGIATYLKGKNGVLLTAQGQQILREFSKEVWPYFESRGAFENLADFASEVTRVAQITKENTCSTLSDVLRNSPNEYKDFASPINEEVQSNWLLKIQSSINPEKA